MSEKEEKLPNNLLIRVSTREIDETIQKLQMAFADGRLDEDDFDHRMQKAMLAKTRGDLGPLIEDLLFDTNSPSHCLTQGLLTRTLGANALAIFSGIEQKGHFTLPASYRITAIMGGCTLDLRQALFESQVSEIHVTAIMGGVQIFIPEDVKVFVQGWPIMGGFSHHMNSSPHRNTFTKEIRIRGVAIMGGVDVRTK
jgi:hypothetical protein